MIGLGLVVAVVAIVVLVVASQRRREVTTVGTGRLSSRGGAEVLDATLRKWVDAGLISVNQADAIVDHERMGRGAEPRSRVAPAMEAIAYVGGALLSIGAGMLVGRFWERISTPGHYAILAVAAAICGVVGTIIGESDPVAERLRSVLWGLCAIGSGAVAALVANESFDVTDEPVAFTAAATTAIVSAAFWRLGARPLQHAITFVATAVAIGTGIASVTAGNSSAWIGLAVWVFGATWAALAWSRFVPPAFVGLTLGATATLVGAGIVGGRSESLATLLGLVTAAAWIGVGIATDEGFALAPGVVGIFVFLPWTIGYFFGETLGAPVIVMISGALLLGVVALLWRRRGPGGSIGGSRVGRSAMSTRH